MDGFVLLRVPARLFLHTIHVDKYSNIKEYYLNRENQYDKSSNSLPLCFLELMHPCISNNSSIIKWKRKKAIITQVAQLGTAAFCMDNPIKTVGTKKKAHN